MHLFHLKYEQHQGKAPCLLVKLPSLVGEIQSHEREQLVCNQGVNYPLTTHPQLPNFLQTSCPLLEAIMDFCLIHSRITLDPLG